MSYNLKTEITSKFWSFNRSRDSHLIETETIIWDGPFSWPKYSHNNQLGEVPDAAGVYLFTFNYKDGYIIRSAGVSNSIKRRISQDTREYKKGNYTVLDVESGQIGIRQELWHGWSYAKENRAEFYNNQDTILKAVDNELASYRLFIAKIPDKRKRARLEFSIMHDIYSSHELWSDLVDRGMNLTGRFNKEIPIKIKNSCQYKLYGLPDSLEI